MSSSHTTYSRLYGAVDALAVSTDSLQKRLEGAGQSIMHLKGEDFPGDLQIDFENIMKSLTNKDAELEGEGKLAATARQLTDDDAAKIASSILNLFDSIATLKD
jgi:hypothetical protein